MAGPSYRVEVVKTCPRATLIGDSWVFSFTADILKIMDINLDKLIDNEQTYQPSVITRQQLKDRDFIMVVGPVAIGKSTLMNKV